MFKILLLAAATFSFSSAQADDLGCVVNQKELKVVSAVLPNGVIQSKFEEVKINSGKLTINAVENNGKRLIVLSLGSGKDRMVINAQDILVLRLGADRVSCN